jgi:ribokinase
MMKVLLRCLTLFIAMQGKIIVIGSSNTDMVIKAPKLPMPGETILGGQFHLFPGGKGANQAVAAARLGGNVLFIAKTGNDVFGKQAIGQFKKEGIDTTFVSIDNDNPSGVALIMVGVRGENIISVAPGANAHLSEGDVDKATVGYAIEQMWKLGKKVILNPAPAQPLPEYLYEQLYLITPNETEAEILTGIPVTDEEAASKAALALKGKGVKQVVLTMGAKGAFVVTDTFNGLITAPKVQAVDTTAAGDVFNGALAVAIAEGLPLERAVDFACQAGAISVTRMGAQASAPYLHEMKSEWQ